MGGRLLLRAEGTLEQLERLVAAVDPLGRLREPPVRDHEVPPDGCSCSRSIASS